MNGIDDATAFATAREMIAEHGDDVARVLQDKIDAAMASRDYAQFWTWFVIRNAVAVTLDANPTLQ